MTVGTCLEAESNAWAESEGSNKEVGHLFTPIFSVQRRYCTVGRVMQDPESSKEGEGETALKKTRWTKFWRESVGKSSSSEE